MKTRLLHGVLASVFLSAISISYGFNTLDDARNDSNFKKYFRNVSKETKINPFKKQTQAETAANIDLAKKVLSKLENVYLDTAGGDLQTKFEKREKEIKTLHAKINDLYTALYSKKFNAHKFAAAYKKLAGLIGFELTNSKVQEAKNNKKEEIYSENNQNGPNNEYQRLKDVHAAYTELLHQNQQLEKDNKKLELENNELKKRIAHQEKDVKRKDSIIADFNDDTSAINDKLAKIEIELEETTKIAQDTKKDLQILGTFLKSDKTNEAFEQIKPTINKLIEQGILTGSAEDYAKSVELAKPISKAVKPAVKASSLETKATPNDSVSSPRRNSVKEMARKLEGKL